MQREGLLFDERLPRCKEIRGIAFDKHLSSINQVFVKRLFAPLEVQ
jgi:hypothetical protein